MCITAHLLSRQPQPAQHPPLMPTHLDIYTVNFRRGHRLLPPRPDVPQSPPSDLLMPAPDGAVYRGPKLDFDPRAVHWEVPSQPAQCCSDAAKQLLLPMSTLSAGALHSAMILTWCSTGQRHHSLPSATMMMVNDRSMSALSAGAHPWSTTAFPGMTQRGL